MSQAALAAPTAFSLASKTGDERDALFRWKIGEFAFSVSAVGTLELNAAAVERRKRPLKFPLEKNEWISRLSALEHEGSLFLAFDTDDGDTGRGILCRVAIESTSIRWCRDIPGFNIFGATGRDGAIFVGAIGFLGRLDPETGKLLWQQSGLYARDKAFNIFCAPEEDDDRISMYGTTGVPSTVGKRVVLDRQTGKILSISEAELPGGCR